jgi:hypothetical protein
VASKQGRFFFQIGKKQGDLLVNLSLVRLLLEHSAAKVIKKIKNGK